MRILYYSNAPWAGSGYGTQSAQLLLRLRKDGHEVAVANNYGLQAGNSQWEGFPIFAQGYDGYSRDVLLGHAAAWQADWIMTLFDVWILDRELFKDIRVASWVPVDSDPVAPGVLGWCQDHLPIAMSKFGQEALERGRPDLGMPGVNARYAPHAIEPAIYHPRTNDLRAQLQVPDDAFLVLINAANKGQPPRKGWTEMLDAFGQFSQRHDDAYLLINTDLGGQASGVPLPQLIKLLGLRDDRLRVVPQYEYLSGRVSSEHVAGMYSASDVLLSTSMGEGFGLAVIESQACGTPVIVTDFTAQPELVGAGWTVPYQKFMHYGHNSWWAQPLTSEIVARLEDAYEAKGDEALRSKAVEFAAQYDADLVYDTHWRPVLKEMGAALNPPVKRKGKSNSARRRAKKVAA